jgi:hypothetical protein
MCRRIVVEKIPGPTFLRLRPDAVSSRDQSLNHLLLTPENSKFDLLPNTFEWLPSLLLFWKLNDGLSVHRLVTSLSIL